MSPIPHKLAEPTIINTKKEERKQNEYKKREFKAMEKTYTKKAKENSRANRDEDMDYFSIYYAEKHPGLAFKSFKTFKEHPSRIESMLKDSTKARKM